MHPRVAIVGAGFGGIGLGIRLRQAGIDSFTILEKADGVGGVWRDNTYPGLTCDIPSHLYSFSFEPKHDWSRRFPARREILDYLEGCVRKHGLERHLRLGTAVTEADFDEGEAVWRITTDGDEIEADVLVTATGQLSRPAYPVIEGLDDFEGPVFHSGQWDDGVELDGTRVAVLGTGASAIQLVPEIARQVEQLDLYQRSAPWVLPKPDRPYSAWEQRLYRRLPVLQRLQPLKRPLEAAARRRLERDVPDPELRARLLPDYPLGCKRVLISDEWYPTLQRPNVEVVGERIARVGTDRIVTDDGTERPADAIILATGFRATEFLAPMQIRGLEGRDLNEAWRDGAEAYLGLAVSGFPNLFALYGPNTNLGAGSMVYILESQIAYVLDSIGALARSGARYMDVRPEVQRTFNAELQHRLNGTVWETGCSNWYRTESGKITNNWPGVSSEYRRRTRRLELADYRVAGAG